jgi:two-component system LytT family response regulator
MTEIRAIIVDDEPPARRGVRQLLEAHADINVVRECRDGREALRALEQLKPDLIFLDIQMPELDGFDVLRIYGPKRMPPVIFVTAFDEFAVRAFEANALDYLIKPLNRLRFDMAIARFRERRALTGAQELARRLAALLDTKSSVSRIAVPHAGSTLMLPVEVIDWIAADDYFAKVHAGSQCYLVRESLASFESRLNPDQFIRVHRSAIVRADRVRELRIDDAGELTVVLANGVQIPVSRRQRAKVRALLTARGRIHAAR